MHFCESAIQVLEVYRQTLQMLAQHACVLSVARKCTRCFESGMGFCVVLDTGLEALVPQDSVLPGARNF